MRTKGLGWLWGLAERRKLRGGWGGGGGGGGGGTQAVGADGPAGGPCGVLYGKNQRRGRRRVRRRRIFIQPPEMVERQLGVAFLMRSGSSCVGTAQPTFLLSKICFLFFTMFLFRSSLIYTLSAPKYKSLYRFHHGLHMEQNE